MKLAVLLLLAAGGAGVPAAEPLQLVPQPWRGSVEALPVTPYGGASAVGRRRGRGAC